MAFDYSGFAETADELVTEYGTAITLLKSGTTEAVSGKPWRGVTDGFHDSPAGTETAATGAFFDYEEAEGSNEVMRGDKVVLVAAKDLPDLDGYDGVRESDGTVWKIVKMRLLKPAATRLLYSLQVRQ